MALIWLDLNFKIKLLGIKKHDKSRMPSEMETALSYQNMFSKLATENVIITRIRASLSFMAKKSVPFCPLKVHKVIHHPGWHVCS